MSTSDTFMQIILTVSHHYESLSLKIDFFSHNVNFFIS